MRVLIRPFNHCKLNYEHISTRNMQWMPWRRNTYYHMYIRLQFKRLFWNIQTWIGSIQLWKVYRQYVEQRSKVVAEVGYKLINQEVNNIIYTKRLIVEIP